jgi:hypothetical protein
MPKSGNGKRQALPPPPPDDEVIDLTPREMRLAMLYAEGKKSLSACCREVGLHPDSNAIQQRVKYGNIGQAISRRMRELGLGLDPPLLKIREMYDAKKEVVTVGTVMNDDGKVLRGSEIVELRDNDSQRWAAEQNLKLLNAYPKDDLGSVGNGPVAVNIVFAQGPQSTKKTGIQIVTIERGEGNGNGHD